CLIVPSLTRARNSSTLNPAPIFFCNGNLRFDASTIRSALAWSIRCDTAPSVITSLSITNPGFTPVPTSATPQSLAAESSFLESSGYVRYGYESSSHVDTTHDSASKHRNSWSITFGSEEEVVCITMSAACPRTSSASPETFTPHGASLAPI